MTETQEKFMELLNDRGYESLRQFATENKIDPANLHASVTAKKYRPSLTKMFFYARVLCVPIEVMLDIFYPAEMEENSRISKMP